MVMNSGTLFPMPGVFPPNDRMRMLWQKGLDVLKPSQAQLAHGLELHRECLVCDIFGFLPMVWSCGIIEELNAALAAGAGIREWRAKGEVLRMTGATFDRAAAEEFLAAIQAAGVTCIVQTVGNGGAPEVALWNMAARAHTCHIFNRHLFQAVTAEEIQAAKTQRRTAIIWSVNGPPGAANDPADMLKWLEIWYHLGVRLMHLAYNRRNTVAGGCIEERDDGLSDFGREYIQAMNRLGVIVDVPHCSRQTVLDAAKLSANPIMASHTGSRALFDHPRCRTDAELKAIAGTGGMVGIYFEPPLLGPKATIATVLDHLDAVVKVIGTEHVGIGSDLNHVPGEWPPPAVTPHPAMEHYNYPGTGWKPEHFRHESREHINGSLAWTNWPLVTVGLVMRGYGDDVIRQIMAGNFMRVLAANRRVDEVAGL